MDLPEHQHADGPVDDDDELYADDEAPTDFPWLEPDGPDPWEQMPGEGAKAYAAFVAYRDMGAQNRSIRSLARQLGKSVTLVGRWSSHWWWIERCRLHDTQVANEARQAEIEERTDMVRFHANLSRQVLQKVAQRVVGNEAAGIKAIDPNELGPSDVARLLDTAAKLERLSRGEATEHVHSSTEDVQPGVSVSEVLARPEMVLRLHEIAHEIEDEITAEPG